MPAITWTNLSTKAFRVTRGKRQQILQRGKQTCGDEGASPSKPLITPAAPEQCLSATRSRILCTATSDPSYLAAFTDGNNLQSTAAHL